MALCLSECNLTASYSFLRGIVQPTHERMLVSDGAYVSFGRMVRAWRMDEALIRNEQALRPQRATAKLHCFRENVSEAPRERIRSPERTYLKPRENVSLPQQVSFHFPLSPFHSLLSTISLAASAGTGTSTTVTPSVSATRHSVI